MCSILGRVQLKIYTLIKCSSWKWTVILSGRYRISKIKWFLSVVLTSMVMLRNKYTSNKELIESNCVYFTFNSRCSINQMSGSQLGKSCFTDIRIKYFLVETTGSWESVGRFSSCMVHNKCLVIQQYYALQWSLQKIVYYLTFMKIPMAEFILWFHSF
jgi:hypothetical protein